MFEILLVEDEPPILRLLKKTIENADSDFAVTKSCTNVKDAIDCLEKEHFDVVVTDIRMPVMSGIELAGYVYENFPEIKVVLISGHQDFDYARKALEYKVFDYILKPVSKDKIKELTVRLRRESEKKNQVNKGSADVKYNAAALFCAGAYLLYGSQVFLPGDGFWADGTIEKYLERNLVQGEEYMFYNSGIGSERLLLLSASSKERQESIIKSLYKEVQGRALPVTVAYKTDLEDNNVSNVFSHLRHKLSKHIVLNRSSIIDCDIEQDGFEYINHLYTKNDIESIVSAAYNVDEERLQAKIHRFLKTMDESGCTQDEINGFLNVILDTYRLTYPDKLKRKYLSVKHEFVNALAGFTAYDKFEADIVSILMTLRSDAAQQDRYAILADAVEQYLLENYNKTISNDILADKFGFVPSYISRLFKREKGVSPNEYITNYRIELAKKLIVENPELRINEIADMVGFKEPYYFSKVFKRKTGVWPTEYGK